MALSKAFHPFAVIHDLKRTILSIRDQRRSARRENERLRKENEHWRQRAERLERERDDLRDENERLKRQLEDAQRAAKRQAAPFARGVRKANPWGDQRRLHWISMACSE
jgi:septal ring factor EnvC (AmiA/AmiB activator)